MTLANRITLFRLILIPVFLVLIMSYTQAQPAFRWGALAVFAVAAVSDALDGFVARAYNQKTRLGAVLDPLADKLLVNFGFVFMAANHEFRYPVPAWFPVLILGRDVIIVIGSYLINEYFGPLRVRPRIAGKLTTVFQMAAIVSVLIEWRRTMAVLILTLAVSVVSFVDYLYTGVKQVGNEDVD